MVIQRLSYNEDRGKYKYIKNIELLLTFIYFR